MLIRRHEIEQDECEIQTRWVNGGYSDDLIVGACAKDHRRTIATPIRALFPNTVKKDVTFAQTWDFMRRQIFTLITYSSMQHWCMVSGIMFISILGGFIPVPCAIMSALTLVCAVIVEVLDPEIDVLLFTNVILSLSFFVLFFIAMRLQRSYLMRCWKLARDLSPDHPITEFTMGWTTQVMSFLLQSVLSPFIAIAVLWTRSSVWGGITYHVRCGRVVRIDRPDVEPTAKGEVEEESDTDASTSPLAEQCHNFQRVLRCRPAEEEGRGSQQSESDDS